MFSFHRPSGNHNNAQAMTAREQASMQSLMDAFGSGVVVGQTMGSLGESAPRSSSVEVESWQEDVGMANVVGPWQMSIDDLGTGEHRVPASNPGVMRPCVSMPRDLAPDGHVIEDHHICENCTQGRKRKHRPGAVGPVCPETGAGANTVG